MCISNSNASKNIYGTQTEWLDCQTYMIDKRDMTKLHFKRTTSKKQIYVRKNTFK